MSRTHVTVQHYNNTLYPCLELPQYDVTPFLWCRGHAKATWPAGVVLVVLAVGVLLAAGVGQPWPSGDNGADPVRAREWRWRAQRGGRGWGGRFQGQGNEAQGLLGRSRVVTLPETNCS